MNTSLVADHLTAKTNKDVAKQRAENLFVLGAKNVLELCVGPSLRELESAYKLFNIKVTGNDIDPRWKRFYPKGNWIIGDALNIDYKDFDAIVFAPPLSRGCSGKREDSLRISQVNPSYKDFLLVSSSFVGLKVLVLPGRSLATRQDRKDFYNLVFQFSNFEIVEMKSKNITKYFDLYLK